MPIMTSHFTGTYAYLGGSRIAMREVRHRARQLRQQSRLGSSRRCPSDEWRGWWSWSWPCSPSAGCRCTSPSSSSTASACRCPPGWSSSRYRSPVSPTSTAVSIRSSTRSCLTTSSAVSPAVSAPPTSKVSQPASLTKYTYISAPRVMSFDVSFTHAACALKAVWSPDVEPSPWLLAASAAVVVAANKEIVTSTCGLAGSGLKHNLKGENCKDQA